MGVILDSHLTCNDHVSKEVLFCFSKLCQINRVKASFDSKTLLLIISSLVFSKMLSCSSVWSNINKIQSIYDHITSLLRQLIWLPVKQLLLIRDSVMAYKCLNGLAPSYLCSKLCKRSNIYDRFTRNRDSLQTPLFKKTAHGFRPTYFHLSRDNHLEQPR